MHLPWSRSTTSVPDNVVYVVTAFWDLPRQGVALVRGQLTLFEAVFDDAADDYSALYLLTPLPPALREVVEQVCAYEYRWFVSYWYGLAPSEHDEVLPEDALACGLLRSRLAAFLKSDPQRARCGTAEFATRSRPEEGGWMRAQWTV